MKLTEKPLDFDIVCKKTQEVNVGPLKVRNGSDVESASLL